MDVFCPRQARIGQNIVFRTMDGEKCSKETISRLDGEQIVLIPVFENCSLLGFFKYCSYYFNRRVSKNYQGKVLVSTYVRYQRLFDQRRMVYLWTIYEDKGIDRKD